MHGFYGAGSMQAPPSGFMSAGGSPSTMTSAPAPAMTRVLTPVVTSTGYSYAKDIAARVLPAGKLLTAHYTRETAGVVDTVRKAQAALVDAGMQADFAVRTGTRDAASSRLASASASVARARASLSAAATSIKAVRGTHATAVSTAIAQTSAAIPAVVQPMLQALRKQAKTGKPATPVPFAVSPTTAGQVTAAGMRPAPSAPLSPWTGRAGGSRPAPSTPTPYTNTAPPMSSGIAAPSAGGSPGFDPSSQFPASAASGTGYDYFDTSGAPPDATTYTDAGDTAYDNAAGAFDYFDTPGEVVTDAALAASQPGAFASGSPGVRPQDEPDASTGSRWKWYAVGAVALAAVWFGGQR